MGLKKDIIEAEFRTTGANKLHHDISATEGEIKRLNKENEMLMVNKKKLEAQNKKGTKAWKQLNDQMKKNKVAINEEKIKLAELNSKLKVSEMSSRQLAKRKRELSQELNNTSKALNKQKWDKLNTELQKVDAQYKKVRVGGTGVNSVMKKMGAVLPIVGFAALVAGAKKLVTNIISVRREFEKYEAMLKVALGSQEAARREMKMLAQFAAETPYQLEQLTGAFVKLTNQGFKPSKDQMRQMGDLAAAMGKDFDQLAEGLIDAQTGEFERLKEFGVRASKSGDQVKFTFKGIETQVKFSADAIQQYIVGLGDMEGIAGSMAEVSKTMGGRISNLGDAWDGLMNTLGSKSSGIMISVINWTIDLVNGLSLASKSLKDIKADVMDTATTDNLQKALVEIDVITQGLVKRGMEQAAAETRAVELYTEAIDFRIQETKKALDQATAAEKDALQTKFDLLVGEKNALKDHYFEVTQLEKKRRDAYNETYAADQKKRREQALVDLEVSNQEEVNLLKQLLLDKEITQQQFEDRVITMKMKSLEKEKELKIKAGENVAAIDEKILDLQLEQMERQASEQQQISDKSAKDKAESMKIYLSELDTLYQEDLLKLKQQLQNKEITQLEYEDKVLEMKLAYMQLELAFREEAGENTAILQNQLMDLEFQLMDRRKARLTGDNVDLSASNKQLFDKMQKDIRRVSDTINSMLDKRRSAMASAKEMYEEDVANLKQKLAEGEISYAEYVDQLSDLRETHYKAEKKAQKDFQKEFLMMLLEQLRNVLYIKIAEIWANEIASKSYWGLITAAALTVAVEGAYSLAKSKLSSGGSYYAGGPTGLGGKYEPAGVVHKNEYVIPEEGYFNPNLRPFINVIEEARKTGNLRNLTMSGVPVSGERGFAAGGPTSAPEGNQGASTDPQLIMLLAANLQAIQKLINEGVVAYIGDKQARDIRDRISVIEGIESSVSK